MSDASMVAFIERTARDSVRTAAHIQQELQRRGENPFTLDWTEIRDALAGATPRSRYLLRASGIENLESEVRSLVTSGIGTPQAIHAHLVNRFGEALEIQQVHRALHKLVRRDAIHRVARNTYEPGKDSPAMNSSP